MRERWLALLLSCACLAAAGEHDGASSGGRKLVCVGRVEPVAGEVEVSAQMSGPLVAVFVREGDWVTNGTVLAEVEARREQAALDVALAKLARVKAGVGKEEIAAAEATREAVAAELVFAEAEYQRAIKLRAQRVVADDWLEERRQRAATLGKQLARAEKQHAALQRGPLPEDMALAEAEVAAARVAHGLRLVRAGTDGVVLSLYRHTGDYVSQLHPSPILRLADPRRLRVRLEVNEQEVARVNVGMAGEFTTFGAGQPNGRLRVTTVLPSFSPRRLFEPDSTARLDTRTLQVLCDILADAEPVYSGQRVTASLAVKAPPVAAATGPRE